MISLLFRAASAPVYLLAVGMVSALCCLCCCRKRCSLRSCACIKCLLRCIGTDPFDDFELMVQVHQAAIESKKHVTSRVRLTVGDQVVKTGKSKKGFFQEVLSIAVEQGTTHLLVELLSEGGSKLAVLKLHIVKDILTHLNGGIPTSRTYHMQQKDKDVLNPSVTLTFAETSGEEEGIGLLAGEDTETTFLMRGHLRAAEEELARQGGGEGGVNELDVLMQACQGPVEVFSGFGAAKKRYLTITGPPISRRYSISVWKDEKDVDNDSKAADCEVDVTKVQGVQADPGRNDVFVISYKAPDSGTKSLTCRAEDRPTKVWVETITLLVTKIHEANAAYKKKRKDAQEAAPKLGSMKSGKSVPASRRG